MFRLEALFNQTEINTQVIFLRLTISFILGGLIGLEREYGRQPAGLRTHILISLGATLLMMVSIFIPQTFENFKNGDPGRIAAQVVSGIGFLGGGAIFRLGTNIKGLTTAATIWVVAGIGLAVGTGLYGGAVLATIFILFVLTVLDKVEKHFFPTFFHRALQIQYRSNKIGIEEVFVILERYKIKVQSINIERDKDKQSTTLKVHILMPPKLPRKKLYKDLNNLENVSGVALTQDL